MTTHFTRARIALLAGAMGTVMLSGAAHAFTFNDGQSGGSSSNGFTSSGTRLTDPVSRSQSRLSGDGTEKSRIQSGPTFQFNSRDSFDQRNTGDHYFNPNNLTGR